MLEAVLCILIIGGFFVFRAVMATVFFFYLLPEGDRPPTVMHQRCASNRAAGTCCFPDSGPVGAMSAAGTACCGTGRFHQRRQRVS